MINAVYIIIGIFVLLVLESFLVPFIGLRIFYLLVIFSQEKVDWKIILAFIIPYSLISDVIGNYPFGTNILIMIIPLAIVILLGIFLNVQDGLIGYVIKLISFILYFVLLIVLPSLLLSGSFGLFSWGVFGACVVKGLISIGLLYLLNIFYGKINGEKGGDNLIVRRKWN
jgi:hypothetical protein